MSSRKDVRRSTRLTTERLLKILLQEIADVRYESKGEIKAMRADFANLDTKLTNRIDHLARNQTSFIRNMEDISGKVTVLETKVA